jgi:hypothetical protein
MHGFYRAPHRGAGCAGAISLAAPGAPTPEPMGHGTAPLMDSVVRRVSPMMVCAMVMVPVMWRRKAGGCEQQQRNRDTDDLTHESTLHLR